jgi:hypothetical protein
MKYGGGGSIANSRLNVNADAARANTTASRNPDLDFRTFIRSISRYEKRVQKRATSGLSPTLEQGFFSGFELKDETKVPAMLRRC